MNKYSYDKNLCSSRFFLESDLKSTECVYEIESAWWSRQYEYPWASSFAEDSDIALDAACGTTHHLKFYLASKCKQTFGCDLDPMVKDIFAILTLIRNALGNSALEKILPSLPNLMLDVANLNNLPYEDKKFNKVYCISVLEHLDSSTLKASLKEFNRVLQDDGLIILTFDYPSVNIPLLIESIDEANLSFLDEVDFQKPENALKSTVYDDLYCIRAVLCKK